MTIWCMGIPLPRFDADSENISSNNFHFFVTQSFKTSSHTVRHPSQMRSRLPHFYISGIGSAFAFWRKTFWFTDQMLLSVKKQIKINYDTLNLKIIAFTQPLSNTFCVPSRRSQPTCDIQPCTNSL